MAHSSHSVKIGLIGAGARLRSVVELLLGQAGGRVVVAGVHDSDPLSVNAAREKFGNDIAVYDSVDGLVRSDIDWAFIGSFNCHHAEQAIAAMRAGRNVFCEKPLATNFEDCLRVRQVEKETGRTFAFGLVLRYSPFYQQLKSLVAEGAIGKLVSFEFNETLHFNHGGYIFGNWRRNRDLAGTHVLEKCCHDLDLANWITGQLPIKAASFGGRNIFVEANKGLIEKIGPGPDQAPPFSAWADPHRTSPFSEGATIFDNQVAILQYTGGVRGTFHTNCNTAILERRFFLCGTEGTLRGNAYTGLIEHQRIGWDTKIEVIDPGVSGSHGGGDEVMAEGLVQTLTAGVPPLATALDGIRSCVAAFGIDASADNGQMVDLQPWWDAIERNEAGESLKAA
jgi:predicted dehydrogenase